VVSFEFRLNRGLTRITRITRISASGYSAHLSHSAPKSLSLCRWQEKIQPVAAVYAFASAQLSIQRGRKEKNCTGMIREKFIRERLPDNPAPGIEKKPAG
jgi:hypothetical protein